MQAGAAPEAAPENLGSWVTPAAGRRDGPQVAMTQIDSGLVRELDSVESRALVRSGSGTKGTVFERGTEPEPPFRSLACAVAREGGVWALFAPTQYTSGTDQRGAK